MSFTSLTFLFFLSLVFVAYWQLQRRGQNLLLLVASYVFYSWWDPRFAVLMLASSVVDYFVGARLDQTDAPGARKAWLMLSLVANLGLLGFFKYLDFGIESARVILQSLGMSPSFDVLGIVLPVGISFYTFQTLSYTIDIYRRQLKPSRRVVDYLAFVSFFPQLVAGPIERASALLPQMQSSREFSIEEANDGAQQILWGLFKKLVIADNVAVIVNEVYKHPSAVSGPVLMMGTVLFAFQIYADFSAYSDIAIGTARLFGIRLSRNFAFPYFSQSVSEFWRRWHISLSTWFRDYVYLPLGGSRVSSARRALNVLITFTVSGLWHGAAWTFIIWGALNGAITWFSTGRGGPKVEPGGEGLLPTPRVVARMAFTFVVICMTWVFFRAASLVDAYDVFVGIFTRSFSPSSWTAMGGLFTGATTKKMLVLALPFWLGVEWSTKAHHHPGQSLSRVPRPVRWILYTLIFWLTMFLQGQTGQFIYFQF